MNISRETGRIFQPLVMYRNACPNCGGSITSDRLYSGLPCHRCLPDEYAWRVKSTLDLIRVLRELNTLRGLEILETFQREYERFSSLFERAVGAKMWGAQRLWARRLIKGKSFAIIAPTGSGKTTFGIVAAIYVSYYKYEGKGRVLMVFPTSVLADQVYKRLVTYLEKLNLRDRVTALTYNTLLTKSERQRALEQVEKGEFNILVVTNMFIPRYMDVLRRYRFDLVFVDDVDSILKASSRNVDRLLLLLGIPEDALKTALKIVEILKEIRRLRRAEGNEEEIQRRYEEIRKLEEEIRRRLEGLRTGILIASGALVKAKRSARVRLFREFLGFETGGRAEGLRNVVDTYTEIDRTIENTVLRLVKRIGDGGIIYVPTHLGKEFAEKLEKLLTENGVKALAYLRPKRGVLEKFSNGELDVLIGLATSRSALVRGIDLPHRVKYVIFAGVPRIRFRLNISEFRPGRYIALFMIVRNVLDKDERLQVDKLVAKLRNIVGISEQQLNKIIEAINQGREDSLTGFDKYVAWIIKSSIELASKILSKLTGDVIEKLDVRIERDEKGIVVTLPDTTTYIQGSGRTSRMYVGGVTKGLSIVIVDDEKVFRGLERELKYRIDGFEFKHLSQIDLESLVREINEERKRVADIIFGRVRPGDTGLELLRTALIVVESPTKARTIASFFGRPSTRVIGGLQVYETSIGNLLLLVTATKGHMWELVPEAPDIDVRYVEENYSKIVGEQPRDYFGVLKIGNYFVPIYNIIRKCPRCGETYSHDVDKCPRCGTDLVSSGPVITALRDIATEVDLVFIGTDPDAEGEKIAWDIYVILRPYLRDIYRIEFHEVTRKAILDAINNPIPYVRVPMVMAQLIRRIEDRWIGFGLSQKLWKVSPILFGRFYKTLSAGRVQTPVLGWVIRRYDLSRKDQVYSLAIRLNNGLELALEIPVDRKSLLKDIKARSARVKILPIAEDLEETINPPPPYTTDTLLRDAATRLRMSVEEAMQIAQELFESGLITYHRTDSTRVSPAGIAIAREYIVKNFGEQEFVPRQWILGGHIGAHECIRPTRPIDADELRALVISGVLQLSIRLTQRHLAMYDMIFRRFIASQMRPARIRKARYEITIEGGSESHSIIVEKVTNIVEEGFLKVLRLVDLESRLPSGEFSIEEITRPPRRIPRTKPMTEGEVVAEMKQKGIGRPSTYARIVEVILRRRYAICVGRPKYLVPTKKGLKVYLYLTGDEITKQLLLKTRSKEEKERIMEILTKLKDIGAFRELVSEERTRLVQQLMDDVEHGERDYLEVLNELYEEAERYNLFEKFEIKEEIRETLEE
ncbi:MAG: reverse gyrase [Crenarchaeota archaeon]|nr:reverse gyrase [Thermoproteota archaeon]